MQVDILILPYFEVIFNICYERKFYKAFIFLHIIDVYVE